MSESASEAAVEEQPRAFRTPEQEQAQKGANVPDASELAIEDINPLNAHLFKDNRWQEFFARLRAEDPAHLNEIETAGRYWSLTRYEDIMAVDSDFQKFSSQPAIALFDELLPEQQADLTSATSDQPE